MKTKAVKTFEEEISLASERIKAREQEFQKQTEKLESKIKTYTIWAWIFVGAGFVIALIGLALYCYRDPNKYSLNLLGDFYGGSVASIWSLAGLILIYVAFLGQKLQLLNQQLEIMHSQLEVKYARFELEGQKLEMKQQNKTLSKQSFENTFFQLLSTHSNILNAIDLRSKNSKNNVIATGRDCFNIFYNRLSNEIESDGEPVKIRDSRRADIQTTISCYLKFFNENQNDLGHYFRHLYHTIKYIHESDETDKKRYTNLVRAQLSSFELVLLFYNCLSKHGIDKFKPLIEQYSLLKNMNQHHIFNTEHLKLYNSRAYGSNERFRQP